MSLAICLASPSPAVCRCNRAIWSSPPVGIRLRSGITVMAVSPDGKQLVVGEESGAITLISTQFMKAERVLHPAKFAQHVIDIVFSADGTKVAAILEDGLSLEWSSANWSVSRYSYGEISVGRVSYRNDGIPIFVGRITSVFPRVYNLRTGVIVPGYDRAYFRPNIGKNYIVDYAFGANGRFLATSHHDGYIRVFDVARIRMMRAWRGHARSAGAIAVDGLAKRMVTSGYDGNIRIWNATSGGLIRSIKSRGPYERVIAMSYDGDLVASSCTLERGVRLLKANTGKPIALLGISERVAVIAFDKSGCSMYGGESDGDLNRWTAR